MKKTIEAKTFEVDLSFDGAPLTLCVRLFIHKGKVLGVRRCKLFQPGRHGELNQRLGFDEFVNGKEEFEVAE